MTITDEMVEKARGVSPVYLRDHNAVRRAIEAVAPMLIAQGMREAAGILNGSEDMHVDSYRLDILARAQEIDPK